MSQFINNPEHTFGFDTLQLHVGQESADPASDSRAVPIYQTTSYVFRNSQHAADRFGLADAGNIYGRLTNSTRGRLRGPYRRTRGWRGRSCRRLWRRCHHLYPAGSCPKAGDHVVAQKTIYGGSYNLLEHTLSQFGVETTFVDAHNLEEVEGAIKDNTTVIYLETLGNPNSDIPNIDAISEIAKKHGLPVVVDNTFGTPYLFRPLEHGANIVVHPQPSSSAATVLAGRCDRRRRQLRLEGERKVRPDRRAQPLLPRRFVCRGCRSRRLRDLCPRAILLRDEGACISPFNASGLAPGHREPCRCALTVMSRTPRRSLSSWLVTATSPR